MPTIDIVDGIKMRVFNGDHRPPHFHAVYNEYEALIIIETGDIYAGNLPKRQLKVVANWLEENCDWVLKVFWELNPDLK
jgi:hypothetical protein